MKGVVKMWMDALNEFVKDRQNDKVLAILLVGSYAVGNNDKYSDIDVYFILKDDVKYRERGNKFVKGYLIEYFCNPVCKVMQYMKNDRRGHGGGMANMLINGKELYDPEGIVKKLRKKAYYYRNKKNKFDDLKYYACWCAMDEYKAAKYHNQLQYYICLENLVEAYLYNNDYDCLPNLKIEKVFKDDEYRRKYNFNKFPDNEFNKLVINCFDYPNKENLEKLYKFVLDDGNFDINNFVHIEKI